MLIHYYYILILIHYLSATSSFSNSVNAQFEEFNKDLPELVEDVVAKRIKELKTEEKFLDSIGVKPVKDFC